MRPHGSRWDGGIRPPNPTPRRIDQRSRTRPQARTTRRPARPTDPTRPDRHPDHISVTVRVPPVGHSDRWACTVPTDCPPRRPTTRPIRWDTVTTPDHRRVQWARRLLGTSADPTIQEIDTAYRRLVRRLHPDSATPGDPPSSTLAEAQTARDLLRSLANPARRHEPPPDPRHLRRHGPRDPDDREPDIRAGPVRYHGRGRPRR